jgi:hypothetical protein
MAPSAGAPLLELLVAVLVLSLVLFLSYQAVQLFSLQRAVRRAGGRGPGAAAGPRLSAA